MAAFRQGLDLDTTVPDEPIGVPLGANGDVKFIANYDNRFKGPIPIRQALAESRNAVAVWIALEIGVDKVIRTARELGIRTPLQPYVSTALASAHTPVSPALYAVPCSALTTPETRRRAIGAAIAGDYWARELYQGRPLPRLVWSVAI
jgi:membrane peptidoglycan carboxypeptidase